MKKFGIFLLFLLGINISFALESEYEVILDSDKVSYSIEKATWSYKKDVNENSDIILKKNLIEGYGSHSIYKNLDESLCFALATDCEFIYKGEFIIVDNNLLKYYKLIYNEGTFEQIELSEEEILSIFPQTELCKMSKIDSDNKIWLHKPLFKKKHLILVNDTAEKFFHNITCNSKNVQDSVIKGLITIHRYGRISFSHFGEKDGKLIFYIR